jgi:flagellar motor switch protein FliG
MAPPPLKKPGKGVPGSDRVAALLMVMGKPMATRLMKHFKGDELKQVTRAIADLRSVPPTQLEALVEDFAGQFAGGANLVGTAGEVEKMLDGVIPRSRSTRSWPTSSATPTGRSGNACRASPRRCSRATS